MSAIQFHTDQAFVAQQLANTSIARARTLRTALVAKLRHLYETDHDRAAASSFVVDDDTVLALHGLLQDRDAAPPSEADTASPLDHLLMRADPSVLAGSHPSISASRAALTGDARSSRSSVAPFETLDTTSRHSAASSDGELDELEEEHEEAAPEDEQEEPIEEADDPPSDAPQPPAASEDEDYYEEYEE